MSSMPNILARALLLAVINGGKSVAMIAVIMKLNEILVSKNCNENMLPRTVCKAINTPSSVIWRAFECCNMAITPKGRIDVTTSAHKKAARSLAATDCRTKATGSCGECGPKTANSPHAYHFSARLFFVHRPHSVSVALNALGPTPIIWFHYKLNVSELLAAVSRVSSY